MMAARAATSREVYVRRAGNFCRDEFGGVTPKSVLCVRAFAESSSPAEVGPRLLCVALGQNEEEISECAALGKGFTFAQVSAPDSQIRKRFGSSAVDGARIVVGRAADILQLFTPPEGRIIAPTFPAGAPSPPQVPPVVPAGPPPPTPSPFSTSVLKCIRGAEITPAVLDALIGAALEVESRVRPDEQLDELCHQVKDAAIGYVELAKFKECLCPKAPSSLLQLLAGDPSDLEKQLAAGLLVATTVLPFIPP